MKVNINYVQCPAHHGQPMVIRLEPGAHDPDAVTLNICPNCQQQIEQTPRMADPQKS